MTYQINLDNRVIFFSGYPGSGKGTQAKQLAEKLNMVHLSTGELFRKEVKTGSIIGQHMSSYMNMGQIIPQELTFEYLRTELMKPIYRKGIIMDGYPKDESCFDFIIKLFQELRISPFLAIHFSLGRGEVEDRLLNRLHCKICELDYHPTKVPPKEQNKCDKCHHALETRADDSVDSIRKRLDVFERNTDPVLKRFRELGIYRLIDAAQMVHKVNIDLMDLIKHKFNEERGSCGPGHGPGLGLYPNAVGGNPGVVGPYFLRQPLPGKKEQKETYHNHIDADSRETLEQIVTEIEGQDESFWNKIYPLDQLVLGPQTMDPEFMHLYKRLPNFHTFGSDDVPIEEAFATGKMGEIDFDYDQIEKTLEVCAKYRGKGVMTELEQEIFSSSDMCLNSKDGATPDHEKQLQILKEKVNKRFGGYDAERIPNIPKFELHHGFDIPKGSNGSLSPITLKTMIKLSTDCGCNVGGWFMFRKQNTWAYRSNEFFNGSLEEALLKLKMQGTKLKQILLDQKELSDLITDQKFEIGYSLENVIAMWRF